ncbi:pre-rRNA-processing protein ESF1 [Euphorbia lathyris]|uniref:pre-rRNA-processing protein ESF1 n=1 Tax=Euphorbia lathyris TaxID=212925 RepID=UPI0033132759
MGSKNMDFEKKNKKRNKPSKGSVADGEDKIHGEGGRKIIADPRFASVHSDPRFQNVPRRKSKVPIDSRFTPMFTDKKFATGSAPSDKRGKPKKHKPETSLRHFYRIEEEDEDANQEVEKEKKVVSDEDEKEKKVVSDEDESEEEVEEQSDKEELGILDSELAGSESTSESEASESDDTESTTDEEDGEVIYEDDQHEVQVENIPTMEDGTRRLAAVDMDWRHVRAVDLYVVLCSFLPKGGEIVSVAVYPSEFGLQRMQEEELHGPVGLFDSENKGNDDANSSDDDDDDDDEIDDEKLRAYEKSRMRYYFAVVECNSVATAEYLYNACDGVEFERSSNVLDLRFIPDSMEFKNPPRDVATEAPGSYDGLDFHTKALQHSNIPISWDEDEPQRARTLQRKFNADQLADLELKEFLASDESESDEDENDDGAEDESDKKLKKRDKYRALIESCDASDGEDDENQDMEITFNTGLEGLSKRILEKGNKKSETVWEEHLRKQREKKKARKNKSKNSSDDESSDDDEERVEAGDFFVEEPSAKKAKHDTRGKNDKEEKQLQEEMEASKAELELLLADEDGVDNGPKGYNLKHKMCKGKKGKEVPDENKIPTVDDEDPRFSGLFNSSLFALDPTDPRFKRSATYARQVAQRQQKSELQGVEGEHKKQPTKSQVSANEIDNGHVDSESRREKHEISSLIKSIKMKSNQAKLQKGIQKLQKRDTKEMEKPELSVKKKKGKVMKK